MPLNIAFKREFPTEYLVFKREVAPEYLVFRREVENIAKREVATESLAEMQLNI